MVTIIIENRLTELEQDYSNFEKMNSHPVPLTKIIIYFKNSKSIAVDKNVIIRIDGYDCYINNSYFDLREDKIHFIHYFC